MVSVICIKYSTQTFSETECRTDKIYSKSQDQLAEIFGYFQRSIDDDIPEVSAVCLDTEAGHKLCNSFLGIIPSATIEYSNYLNY